MGVGVVALVCARPFLLLSFDPGQTRVAGFRAGLYEWLMLGLVALTVVVSFQTVGTLLVFGMLVAPPATAALVARRIGVMMAGAAVIGVVERRRRAAALVPLRPGGGRIDRPGRGGRLLRHADGALDEPARRPPGRRVSAPPAVAAAALAVGYDGRPW